jgi:hypothetical protein
VAVSTLIGGQFLGDRLGTLLLVIAAEIHI